MNSIGGIIHWIVAGGSELAATLLPAMIALGAGASVMLEGFGDIYTRMNAVNTVGQSLGGTFGKTVGQILGMGDSLQKAQTAADPQVFELLGAAINGVNQSSGQFVQMGSQLVPILDQFAAKIDVDLKNGMTQFTGLIGAGVQDLVEFGQILGNIGHALLNFASAMPGLAEVLLKIIDGISGVILWLSKLPPWIITTVMVIEELFRWGGLLVGIFAQIGSAIAGMGFLGLPIIGKIVTQFGEMFKMLALGAVGFVGNLGKMVTGIGGFLTGAEDAGGALTGFDEAATAAITGASTGLIGLGVAAAAGFAALIMWADNSKTATQQWTDSLISAVNAAKGLQQIGQTYTSLAQVTTALGGAQKQLSQITDEGTRVTTTYQRGVATTSQVMYAATQNVGVLSAAQKQLSTDFGTEVGNVDLLSSKYKIGYVEAAELAGDAGANLTQTMKGNSTAAQINLQMVENYVQGLGGMGAVQGALGGDINAVTIAAGLQNSKIQQLTQSWSTVMSTVQGPSNGFIAISQSLDQFNSDATTAGARMTGLGGATTSTTRNVTDASAKLQGDFNNTVSSMQTYTNSLMTAAAITGNGGPLIQGIKDQIAILLPMAGSNKNAAAQIEVLWQEAGGSASDSLKQIGAAVDGTKNPLQNLQTLTGQVSQSLANLGQDASNLAQTISTSLNQTLVAQAEQLTGVSAKSETYLQALQKYGPNSAQAQAALGAMNSATSQATELASEAAAGVTALSGNVQKLGTIASQTQGDRTAVNNDIASIEKNAPNAATDIGKLSTAVQDTGTKSSSTSSARAQLIKDLESMNVNAQTATKEVDGLVTAISKLQNKTVTITTKLITETSAGSTISSGTGIPTGVAKAASGMLVPGHGSGDTVPAMLTPGEAVVPKHLVSAVAPFLAANKVPGFASGGMVTPMLPPVPDTTGLAALQQQITGTTGSTAAYLASADKDAVAVATAAAALAAAKKTLADKTLTEDQQKYNVAKAADASMTKLLAAAQKSESAAGTHLDTVEKMKKGTARDLALDAAFKIYDADKAKVAKDKASLKTIADTMSTADRALVAAKNVEKQAAFTLWQKQGALTGAEHAASQAEERTANATKALDAIQGIQAGTASISALNSLLLPGTPLATLVAALPGVGLSYGAPNQNALAPALVSAGLPIASFDSGGFLPPGLSLAMNGTGAPERVGGGGDDQVMHNHITVHLDGQQIWQSTQKQGLKYGIRNNGVATGLMKPR